MGKPVKCLVEILCIEDNFVSFDFGEFAFVLMKEGEGNQLYICADHNYNDHFVSFCEDIDWSICSQDSVAIPLEHFKEARALVSASRQKSVVGWSRRFFKEVFPGYFSLFVK